MRDIVWVNDVISLSNSRLVQVSLSETNRNDGERNGRAHLHRVSVYSNRESDEKVDNLEFLWDNSVCATCSAVFHDDRRALIFCLRARAYEQKQLNRNKFMRLSYSRLNLLKWNFTAAAASSAAIEPERCESTSAAGLMLAFCGVVQARRSTSSTLGEARNIFILYGLIKKMIDKIFERKWNEKLLQVLQAILSIFISLSRAHRATLAHGHYYYYLFCSDELMRFPVEFVQSVCDRGGNPNHHV